MMDCQQLAPNRQLDPAHIRHLQGQQMLSHAHLLQPLHMAQFHAAIAAQDRWYTHLSSIQESLTGIQQSGLVPRTPKGTQNIPPEVISYTKVGEEKIVCLFAEKSEATPPWPVHPKPPLFQMAVHAKDLPTRLGVDWSYTAWDLVAGWMQTASNMPVKKIAEDCVRRYGVLVSYDAIPPDVIRVCPVGGRNAPMDQWPFLKQIQADDLELFS